MLLGEDLGGGHEGGIDAGIDGEEHGGDGDEGFSGADVALEEAVHGAGAAHVGDDFLDGAFLCVGEVEGERVVEAGEEGGFFAEGAALVGEVEVALVDDVELEGEEGFEGEAAAGGF